MRATVEGLDVFLTHSPGKPHRATLRALGTDDVEAVLLAFDIAQDEDHFSITGEARAELAPLVPLLRFYGVLPEEVTAIEGAISGPIGIQVPVDTSLDAPIQFQATLDEALRLDLQAEGRERFRSYPDECA